jgi:hypothetical protein
MLKRLGNHLDRKTISFDFRSLALWRIITGLAVLYDLVFYKFLFLEKYYFSGILRPESAIEPYYGTGFDVVNALGENAFIAFIFFSILLSICFTIGLLDRFVKPILFFCYSLIMVNSLYLITGFHFMVLVSLFWSIFLPTGTVWSCVKHRDFSIHPLALYGLYLQIALIYLTSFLVKNGAIWLDGNAIELVVQDEYFASGFGFQLRNYPLVLKVLTYVALVWEFLIPVFILWPFKRNLKLIAAMMIVLLHLGIMMMAQVGPFLIMGMAFSAALLPKHFWERWKFLKNDSSSKSSVSFKGVRTAYLKTFLLLAVIAIMLKGNLRYWYLGSHVSPLMRSIPGSYDLFYKRWIPLYFLYGFNDQPWVFFQMNATSDLGLYLIIEENEAGVFSLNGIEIGKEINDLNNIDQAKFINGFGHHLEYTDYLYTVSLKDYSDRFTSATYQEMLVEYSLKMDKEKEGTVENLYLVYLSKTPNWNGTSYAYEFHTYCLQELNLNDLKSE